MFAAAVNREGGERGSGCSYTGFDTNTITLYMYTRISKWADENVRPVTKAARTRARFLLFKKFFFNRCRFSFFPYVLYYVAHEPSPLPVHTSCAVEVCDCHTYTKRVRTYVYIYIYLCIQCKTTRRACMYKYGITMCNERGGIPLNVKTPCETKIEERRGQTAVTMEMRRKFQPSIVWSVPPPLSPFNDRLRFDATPKV